MSDLLDFTPENVPDRWWVGTAWEAVHDAALFDEAWYRSAYPGVAPDGDPLFHYVKHGAGQGFAPNPLFDTAWYLTTYPDVARAGVNPLVHYAEFGAAEGRDPGPGFDTAYYLEANPDVRAARRNPLGHFLVHGIRDGRRPRPRPTRAHGSTALRVVFVSGEPGTPGHRYRLDHVADAVRALGGHALVRTVPEAASSSLADVMKADVVWLWRTVWGTEVERIVYRARRSGAAIVFDVDDLMVDPRLAVHETIDGIRSQGLTEADAQDYFARMGITARAADVCTTTTRQLATALRRFGSPVFELPNGFDDSTWVQSRLARRVSDASPDDGLVRLGYASGSLTHQRDFAVVAPAVAALLARRSDVRLVLFRRSIDLDEFPAFDAHRHQIEWREIVPHVDLPDELARFDVNLAPLEVGNPFCEAKSNLKFFEAALVGVPTVASPTQPFVEVIEDGVNGFLAHDGHAWTTVIDALVGDADLRRRVADAARADVRWPLGPLRRQQQVKAILDQVLGTHVGADAFALELQRANRAAGPPPALAPWRTVAVHDRLRPARVTVVVPVHDYADVVVEALDSVAAQTLVDLDLVVVDDASTDESLARVEAWMSAHRERFARTVLVTHSANAGVACARNAGFALAETPFVLPLDADNALLPRSCERLLAAIGGGEGAFAYPRIVQFGDTTDLGSAGLARGYLPWEPQRLVGSNHVDAMALVRVDAWATVGGYRNGLTGWEDYDLWCRFAEQGLLGVQVAEDLARYRVHTGSMLHTVTHAAGRIAEVHAAVTTEHPWLDLDPDGDDEVPTAALATASTTPLEPREQPPTSDRHPRRPAPHDHVGNPLPDRAVQLLRAARGPVLHLSGGGTRAGGDRVIELDHAVFANTGIVGDVHALPFADASFELVVVMNAFEHYQHPDQAVLELQRVLRPGGLLFVHTAFLQPLHEAPHHYFNATRFGVATWFEPFETVDLVVSDNFHPGHALAWLASDAEAALATDVSDAAAQRFRATPMGVFSDLWRDPSRRDDERWTTFGELSPTSLDRLAAGFEYLGRRP